MEELQLAIDYLKSRAIPSDKVNKQLLMQFCDVLPLSEVMAVLAMVQSGEFKDFIKKPD